MDDYQLPCKLCISQAMCKHKTVIHCSILHKSISIPSKVTIIKLLKNELCNIFGWWLIDTDVSIDLKEVVVTNFAMTARFK